MYAADERQPNLTGDEYNKQVDWRNNSTAKKGDSWGSGQMDEDNLRQMELLLSTK
jgi:hypothetical protein